MENASFQFVLFGLAAALLSNISRLRAWRTSVLLVASIAFLALLAPSLLSLIPFAGFLLAGYVGVRFLQSGSLKVQPWIVLAVLFLYIWLKKYSFLLNGESSSN